MVEAIIFYILAVALLGFGLLVITRTNPIASALAMVGAFGALATLYALLSAKLVAVLQILVYAGGIMVLMIFVIMLLNLRTEDLKPLRVKNLPLFLCLSVVFVGMVAPVFLPLFLGVRQLTVVWVSPVDADFGGIFSVGTKLFSDYLFPFEMLSLLLLAAIVGALVLTKRKL